MTHWNLFALYLCLHLLYYLIDPILITLLIVVHYIVPLLDLLLLCFILNLFFPFFLTFLFILVPILSLHLNRLALVQIPSILPLQLLNQLLLTPGHLPLILHLPYLPSLQLNIHPPQFNRLDLILLLQRVLPRTVLQLKFLVILYRYPLKCLLGLLFHVIHW